MKIKEVRELSEKELIERVDAEKAALDQMIINHSVTPLDSPVDIKKKRRDIARMMSVVRERELNK